MSKVPCDGQDTLIDISVLCAERVSQMTKTYHDIEAVTRLLEEKERDLELAARIGQTLLSKNKELSSRTETLEEQLSFAHDKVNQLRHDLSIKDELLRFYNEDLEHEVSGDSPPSDDKGLAMVNVDLLQKKVQALEDENVTLRLESTRLSSATELYEEKEKKLVVDCIQQLGEVNQQVESLAEELRLKSDDNTHQKEQITQFLGQIAELQTKIRRLTLENLDLHEKLTASSESQRKLTKEVGSMQDKYDELSEMLEEAHDELRLMRGKHKVKSTGQHHHSAFGVPTDSLASELELSLQQEISQSNRRAQSWKIFETAKAAKRAAAKSSRKHDNSSVRLSIGATPSQRDSDTSQCMSAYASDVESFASDGYSADMDSLYGSNPELGRPGIPGSNDLESALRRLAMRRANELNERDFQLEEEERKLHRDMSGATSPNSMATSDRTSGHSPGSVSSSLCTSAPGQGYKISDRLQIVKPMEGSMTLRHWQHLATPHLGGIFEPRDGIQMKGERKLDLVEESYSISDFEEDENVHDVHTRKGQELGPIYTFTDSTVASMGPYRGLGDMFNHSMASSSSNITNTSFTTDDSPRITSTPKSQANPEPPVNSQSTFTMSLGLAALLQGRENSGMGQALLRAAASSPRANKSQDLPASSSGPTSQAVTSSADAISPPTRLESLRLLPSQSTASLPPSLSLPATDSVPGSKSFQQAVQEHREKVGVTLAVKDKGMFTSGMTGKGFLQQLKTKGMSLYGLWGGGGNGDGSSSDSQTASMSLPVTSSLDVAGVGDSEQAKTATEMVFSPDGGSGVLGAMTNFRRNGIF